VIQRCAWDSPAPLQKWALALVSGSLCPDRQLSSRNVLSTPREPPLVGRSALTRPQQLGGVVKTRHRRCLPPAARAGTSCDSNHSLSLSLPATSRRPFARRPCSRQLWVRAQPRYNTRHESGPLNVVDFSGPRTASARQKSGTPRRPGASGNALQPGGHGGAILADLLKGQAR